MEDILDKPVWAGTGSTESCPVQAQRASEAVGMVRVTAVEKRPEEDDNG